MICRAITFCDVSELAFGAVYYVRYELPDGAVGVKFVTAKSRVAQQKSLTIPLFYTNFYCTAVDYFGP